MWQPHPHDSAEGGSQDRLVRVVLRPAPSETALARDWRELEERADCSFFQSWTYTGCMLAERFPNPVVLEAYAKVAPETSETLVALCLFNRRRGQLGTERLLLGESGIPSFDTLFIEHNGPLIARGFASVVLPRLFHAALRRPIQSAWTGAARRVVFMSGIGADLLAAAQASRTVTEVIGTSLAPAIDIAGLRRKGVGPLDQLSSNARYQLRRSARRFSASGPLSVRRAADIARAHEWLDALSALHQRTWTARGLPGAFADPNFRRFHHALIDRGLPRGEVDLLEVSAGSRRLGYLLNFVFRGTVYAYQSGFDYEHAGQHEKPGLTCHHQAIDMYLREGMDRYDFLGGAERYKTSFSNTATALHWIALAARWSAPGVLFRLKQRRYTFAARVRGCAGR